MMSPRNPEFRMLRAVVSVIALLSAVLALAFGCAPSSAELYPEPVPLRTAGIFGSGDSVFTVSPERAEGARYLPGSTVIRLAGGRLLFAESGSGRPIVTDGKDDRASGVISSDRAWLDAGRIPGGTDYEREAAVRALLDLRLLTDSGGASIAAPDERWNYVWPRDASWVSAAFSATGHYAEARDVLDFIARTRSPDDTWEARYRPDGEPVSDGRPVQADAGGWFLWSVWFYDASGGDGAEELWPHVRETADAAASSIGPGGLPPGGSDYWEIRTMRPNLGNSAALLLGLRCASDLAGKLGYTDDAARYEAAANRLAVAIEREFGSSGYTRTTWPTSGRDAAVTFLAPPFAPYDPDLDAQLRKTEAALSTPNGGLIPGERWPQEPGVSWTAETAFFALAYASSGDEEGANRLLGWVLEHRTELGAFPEKIDTDGSPKAAAPLGWTAAIVLLTLSAKEDPLPVPPSG